MRGHTVVKWQVLLDDTDWDSEECPPIPQLSTEAPPAAPISPRRRRLLWSAVGMILMAAASGGYLLWRTAQAGLRTVETELEQTIALEEWTAALHPTSGGTGMQPSVTGPLAPAAVALESFDLDGEMACTEVVVEDAALFSPYRETRFYQQTELGWQRTSPSQSFWGAQQEFQSEHFIFLASRRDLTVVAEAAPALDATYTSLCQDLGLSPTVGEKIIVEILTDPTAESNLYIVDNHLRISSLALHQMPVEFSEAEILAQLVKVASARYLVNKVAATWINLDESMDWSCGPFLTGLHLWLSHDSATLLGKQYEEFVGWFYRAGNSVFIYETASLPAGHREICALCNRLGVFPNNLAIPITCIPDSSFDGVSYYIFPPLATNLMDLGSPYPIPMLTAILNAQVMADFNDQVSGNLFYSFLGTNIASFTLIDYVVETYGRETLPILIDAIRTHPHWITVIPAVYDVSVAEFEAGWRAYLQEKYDAD